MKKQLDEVKASSKSDHVGLDVQMAQIKLKSNKGMDNEIVKKAELTLKEALARKNSSLNQVAGLVIDKLK